MAYPQRSGGTSRPPENPLDAKGRAILAQVAFKAAIDVAIKQGTDVTTDEGLFALVNTTTVLADVLTAEVENQVARAGGTLAAVATFDATAALESELGATPVEAEGFSLSVAGEQHGPLPAWLFEKAAAVGVNKVFDNRNRLAESPRSPHFKGAERGGVKLNPKDNGKQDDIPFWPPKD
jgi:hypothetical protein